MQQNCLTESKKPAWMDLEDETTPVGRLGSGRPPPKGNCSMMHFTCDLCGREMRPGVDPRYVVKIEAYAAHDPVEITDEDLDEDHIEAVGELLRPWRRMTKSPTFPTRVKHSATTFARSVI